MTANRQQHEAWNGGESSHYVSHADRYDRQLEAFTHELLANARLSATDRVLDVGCGCGATTLAAARQADEVLGVDISEPLLEIAAARARASSVGNVGFVVADAQTHTFEPDFDVVISQFGLMFFDQPVAAFSNLCSALAPGGRLVFVCWQELAANEWLMALGAAVERHAPLPVLGGLGGGPGMFALKDPQETRDLLTSAGFAQVEIDSVTPSLLLGGGGTVDESSEFLLGTGMARGLLERVEPDARAEVMGALREVLDAHHEPGVGVNVGAAAWVISASRPSGKPRV